MDSPSPSLCEPPWPPDLCVVHRESPSSDLVLRSPVFLHPEAPPCLEDGPPQQISPSIQVMAPTSSPSPALWVSKLKSSSHNLKKMASPTFSADGTPIVKAPDSVVFRPSQTWKGYLVAQFHGTPPSTAKIFSDLNPIWGKQGRIKTHAGSSRWIRVGAKSPSSKARRSMSPISKAKILTSAQFSSEEEMICAAQKVLRNRLADVVMDIPPFATAADRKIFRKHQRHTFRSLC
ncbi:unnamed protein product, partial [Brassica rapa]